MNPKTVSNLHRVKKLIKLFFYNIDMFNWDEAIRLCNENVVVDYVTLSHLSKTVSHSKTLSAKEYLGNWQKSCKGLDSILHLVTFISNEIMDNQKFAKCTTLMEAIYSMDDAELEKKQENIMKLYGFHHFELEMNEKGEWKIKKVCFVKKHEEGNKNLLKLSEEKGKTVNISMKEA